MHSIKKKRDGVKPERNCYYWMGEEGKHSKHFFS